MVRFMNSLAEKKKCREKIDSIPHLIFFMEEKLNNFFLVCAFYIKTESNLYKT